MKAVLHPYQETAAGWLRERPEAALLLATAFGLSVAAGRWTAAAAVVTAALVWAAAACVSRAVSGEAWSGLRRFIPIRRIFRYY